MDQEQQDLHAEHNCQTVQTQPQLQSQYPRLSHTGAFESATADALSQWIYSDDGTSNCSVNNPQIYGIGGHMQLNANFAGLHGGQYRIDGGFSKGWSQPQQQHTPRMLSSLSGVGWRLAQDHMHQVAHPVEPVPAGALDPRTARALGNWMYRHDDDSSQAWQVEAGFRDYSMPCEEVDIRADANYVFSQPMMHQGALSSSTGTTWRRPPPLLDFAMCSAPS